MDRYRQYPYILIRYWRQQAIISFIFFFSFADISANEDNHPEQTMSLHPYFNFDVARNVTTRVGQTAFLQCKVEQIGDKSVCYQIFSLNKNKYNSLFFFCLHFLKSKFNKGKSNEAIKFALWAMKRLLCILIWSTDYYRTICGVLKYLLCNRKRIWHQNSVMFWC